MKIGVLGTGVVGNTIGSRLVELGHEVEVAGRSRFAAAAAECELAFLCVAGEHALSALELTEGGLNGKVLVDVSNPMSWASGSFELTTAQNTSLGEEIQSSHPQVSVVKTFNTMNCEVMVNPGRVPGEHVIFVSGNDDHAKTAVHSLLGELGWPSQRIIDLGDITAARATESYLHLWVRLMQTLGTADFNISINRA